MTDRLGEALADYDKWIADDRHTLPLETFTEVAAAARNWHALTNDEFIEADLWEIRPADTDLTEYVVLLADKVPGHTWPKRVVLVDALMVTPTPEETG